MECRHVQERLSEYWSRELDTETWSAIDAHLHACPRCRGEWENFRGAMEALKSVPPPELPPNLLPRIRNALSQRPPSRPLLWWRSALSFAAVTAFFFAAFALLLRRPSSPPPSRPLRPRPIVTKPSKAPSPSRIGEGKKPQKALPPKIAEAQETLRGPHPLPIQAFPKALPIVPKGKAMPQRVEVGQGAKSPSSQSQTPKIVELPLTPRPLVATAPKKDPFTALPALKGQKLRPALPMPRGLELSDRPKVSRQLGRGKGLLRQVFTEVPPFPIHLRWENYEPALVNRTTVWEVSLRAKKAYRVTVTVRPDQAIEVLNAVTATTPMGKRLVVWDGKIPAQIPLLVRAKEVGARRIQILTHITEGQTMAWTFIFSATQKRPTPLFNTPLRMPKDPWPLRSLLAHLAWTAKVAFLVPSDLLSVSVQFQGEKRTLSDALSTLGRKARIKWQRFGTVFLGLPARH